MRSIDHFERQRIKRINLVRQDVEIDNPPDLVHCQPRNSSMPGWRSADAVLMHDRESRRSMKGTRLQIPPRYTIKDCA